MAHRRVAVAEARASLKDLVDEVRVGGERVKLTRYNRTIAGLVSARDLKLLEHCRAKVAAGEIEPPMNDVDVSCEADEPMPAVRNIRSAPRSRRGKPG